jgi:hypothetical protein
LEETLKHSGLGVASFILSIVGIVGFFVLLIVAGVLENSIDGGVGADDAVAIVIGLLYFLIIGIALVALGFGIAGLCQKNIKKLFAILGVIFAVGLLLFAVLIMIIGVAML